MCFTVLGTLLSSAAAPVEAARIPKHLLPPAGEGYTAIDSNADGSFALAILAPEPSSLTLLALGGVMLLRRRRAFSKS